MLGLNKVQLIGNLGKDPEIRITQNEKKVASFPMAVNRSYKDQDGNTIEDTQWINVETWETLANIVESYLQKGSQVYIEGRLKTQKYKKNGETKYFTKVVVRDMLMLGRSRYGGEIPDEDDIPF